MLRRLLQWKLYWLARFILTRRSPQIIGVTGSVGKTSTKDAIAVVLGHKRRVRATLENYNNELGVPLTIIGAKSGGRNPLRWLVVFWRGLVVGLFKSIPYPEVLVLEMGVDKPGDMKYLVGLAPLDIAIVTAITETPAHMEFFKDIEQLAKEKFTIYKSVEKSGLAIMNADEPRVVALRENFKGLMMTIGIENEADLAAAEIDFAFDPRAAVERAAGLRFKFHYQGSVLPVFVPGVIGKPTVYSALFAAAVGLQYDMNLVEISAALQAYQSPSGRLRVLAGRNNSTLIDDTYNASPAAVKEAVKTLQSLTTLGRKLVCLGEMAELGKTAKAAHTAVGKAVAQAGVDRLLVVGLAGEWIASAAMQAGLPEQAIRRYADSQAAGVALAEQLEPNDVVLIKGSQVARMEITVEACLAQPEKAEQVLVRQHGNWRSI